MTDVTRSKAMKEREADRRASSLAPDFFLLASISAGSRPFFHRATRHSFRDPSHELLLAHCHIVWHAVSLGVASGRLQPPMLAPQSLQATHDTPILPQLP